MEDFKQRLINIQKLVVDQYEEALEDATFETKKIAQDVLHVQNNILRKLGYSPQHNKAESKPPPKDLFKNTNPTDGEVPIDELRTKNTNINKDVFKKKSVVSDAAPKVIENKNVNQNAFKEKELPESEKQVKKANPQRLSQKQISDIKELGNEGFTAVQISDKLMIVQNKVKRILDNMNKGKGNLIATSKKKTLADEVDDYKKGK